MQEKDFDFENYDFVRSLLLCGCTGTGKTYTANSLLQKYIDSKQEQSNIDAYSISDGYFKQMVKSNMLVLRKPEERQSKITIFPLEMMLRSKVLLYDDIGVSDTSEAYLRDLTFILDERMKKNFTTIYTTNLDKDELSQKLNERIVSRMMYNTDVVVFSGKDMRLQTTRYFSYTHTKS